MVLELPSFPSAMRLPPLLLLVLVCLLALIPNPLIGRIAFLFCGGLVAGIGAVLVASARRTARAEAHSAA